MCAEREAKALHSVRSSASQKEGKRELTFFFVLQIEQPRLSVTFQAPTLGTAHANLIAAATADIGWVPAASDTTLLCDILAFTVMQIDQANFLLTRPFN